MEAAFYRSEDGALRCLLCPHECRIADGKTGVCRTRLNEGGALRLLNYGRYTSIALDPIEKKPLYHFQPGSHILSIGGAGCNFVCGFCQNWHISQEDARTSEITPEALANEAAERAPDNVGVAFTYNEPMIWFEFIRDTAPLLRSHGLAVALVTNGFINPKPFSHLAPLVDAMNIDLKSIDDGFYRKYCGGSVEPVMRTIEAAAAAGIWVELTQLLVTGLNDSEEQVEASAKWIASVSPDIPLHLSRYFPNYKMDAPPTPADSMKKAWEVSKRHLRHVYLGNVADEGYGDTVCHSCGAALIRRVGYSIKAVSARSPLTCKGCGTKNAGVC